MLKNTTLKTITPEKIKALLERKELLKATQPKICLPIINRIYIKMSNGIRVPDILVSEGMICDGHHRYLAACLAEVEIGQSPGVSVHPNTTTWQSIIIDEDEWDTPAKIKMYLWQDAKYNGMEYDKLADLLNKL